MAFGKCFSALLASSGFWNAVQANPPNQDNFPFVVLGNKTDLEGGKQRVVRCF